MSRRLDLWKILVGDSRCELPCGAGASMEDVPYYSRRAQQERTAALQTDDVDVREVHLKLAEAYEAQVRDLAASLSCSKLRSVQAV